MSSLTALTPWYVPSASRVFGDGLSKEGRAWELRARMPLDSAPGSPWRAGMEVAPQWHCHTPRSPEAARGGDADQAEAWQSPVAWFPGTASLHRSPGLVICRRLPSLPELSRLAGKLLNTWCR